MIARSTAGLVLAPLVGMAAIAAAALLLEDMRITQWTLPLTVVFLFLLVFFRDPDRVPGPGIVSAADGRVLVADEAQRTLVVFMNLHNVHVNRAPFDGRVARTTYTPGGHAAANRDEAAANERLETVLETALGPITVVQVAGLLARRIVPYVRPGDRVKKGQRIGMIRFGSRLELIVPEGVRFVVRSGDKVRAG
ncbi:MAG: phosphatidylserine decarboxylase, partial [Euryarchaeota archaeon]|nr:phosphatidylserine decarboxylase [Euryarchaeota archaeon]